MIKIGNKIRLNNKLNGTVRYIGSLNNKSGIWVGLELDKPDGKNNGSINGVQYFHCSDSHGMFIRQETLNSKIHKIDQSSEFDRTINMEKVDTQFVDKDEDFEYGNDVKSIVKENLYLSKISKLKKEIADLKIRNEKTIDILERENTKLKTELKNIKTNSLYSSSAHQNLQEMVKYTKMFVKDATKIYNDLVEQVQVLDRNTNTSKLSEVNKKDYFDICKAFKDVIVASVEDDEFDKYLFVFNKLTEKKT